MKKIFTLLWLTLTAFTFNASAQGTMCNAEFATQYLNYNTVKFNPAMTQGAPTVIHYWNFGDGTPVDQTVSPTHTYSLPGIYAVVHTVALFNPNGVAVCTQSFIRQVTTTPECNLVVDFSWTSTTANPLTVAFQNLSVPLAPADSITWSFGDNTISHDVSPTHIYANAGTYTVCLTVKKNNNAGSPPCIKYICKTVVVTLPCTLVVDFNWTVSQTNPLTIEFHNLSVPLATNDTITWTFGDGSSSSAVNPVHTYNVAGTYTVCLRVKKVTSAGGTSCVREICKTVVITQPCNLVVDFSWTITQTNPLAVEFHNLSTPLAPADSITWSFGDNTISHDVNPTHMYANAGSYTVCLTVKKNNNSGTTPCVRYICKTIVITQPCNLVADFNWTVTQTNPLRLEFHNLSTPLANADSTIWSFGDGTSSYDVNPVHTYTSAGTYTICLVVKKYPFINSAPCVRYICKTVAVTQPCNFDANFNWHLDSANQRKVYFTNLTAIPTPTDTATWFFGDGTTATSWNAVHEYAQPGRYYVCLRVELSPNCVRYKCDSVTIPVPPPPCNNQSNFTVVTTAASSQTFNFIPAYQSTAAQYTWTFGDGTGSHDMITTHHYAQAGTYTACLTVWRSSTCASTTCKTVQVTTQFYCDSAHVSYTYSLNATVPNNIHFYAVSTVPLLDQTWTITKLNGTVGSPVTLHQNNPVYLFQDTGLYRVCLRAITLGGCVKEYCNNIHIQYPPPTACTLQAFPNPASSTVNVNVSLAQPEMINAYVYNSLNVLVMDKQQQGFTGNNLVTLNIANLPVGQYTIKVVHGNMICYTQFQKL